jgi:Family of unknown function (DUF5678)
MCVAAPFSNLGFTPCEGCAVAELAQVNDSLRLRREASPAQGGHEPLTQRAGQLWNSIKRHSRNQEELLEQYPEQWVAIYDERVVGADATDAEATHVKRILHPIGFRIPCPPAAGYTIATRPDARNAHNAPPRPYPAKTATVATVVHHS